MIETGNFWWLVIVLSVAAALFFSIGIDAEKLKLEGFRIQPYMVAGAIFALLALCVGIGTYF